MLAPSPCRYAVRALVVLVVLITRPCASLHAAEVTERLSIRISFGHRATGKTTIQPRLIAGSPGVEVASAPRTLTVGGGAVDSVTAEVSWKKPARPPRKPHEIWQYLLTHGTPEQVARL
jgi:hypothetical protein